MVEKFSKMSLELLTGALAFVKFIKSLLPFLNEKEDNLKHLMALSKENQNMIALTKENQKLKINYMRICTEIADIGMDLGVLMFYIAKSAKIKGILEN